MEKPEARRPVAGHGAIDIDEFRANARSLLQDHEALLLERNAMIFELDTAKSSSLREESRRSNLEKENEHLKQELVSSLAALERDMTGVLGHFDAAEALATTRADAAHLREELRGMASANACLAREATDLKAQLRNEREERAAESDRHEKEVQDLRLAIKREEAKWRTNLNEAARTCRELQDRIDKQTARSPSADDTGDTDSLDVLGTDPVSVSLHAEEARALREENAALRDQIKQMEAPARKPAARSRKRTKLAKYNLLASLTMLL